ncbi:CD225/dispanin family protein [Rhodococcus corynebacterioides]|uniref:CD225/dispanin family protein n=1 Tax=Rhodococcoides corynebacterioides TaxID=53972 RepID=A0ABS7NZN0_9NOCA|nr:CD225/dispanin family protein [Rhodococcus corynebacterioides]MBY6406330.1 CD225/dispanin family protein [Rhodococcus corynebacterioides]
MLLVSDHPEYKPTPNPDYRADHGTGSTLGGGTGSFEQTGYQQAPPFPQPEQQQPSAYPQQFGPPPLPPTNAGWAVAALVFFWPLAFSAFNHSSSVFLRWSLGDYQGAHYASERTKQLGKYSLYIFGALFALFIVFYVVIIAVAVSAGSSYDY